ncbi:hypothetical protein Tco_0795421 [Tanacetum coccineum]
MVIFRLFPGDPISKESLKGLEKTLRGFSEEACSQYHEHVHQQSIPVQKLDLEFLDSVIQCFQNTCQRANTELVYFVEPHDLLFIVVDREDYCSRRLNDGIVMLELIAGSIPSWFSKVQLCNTPKLGRSGIRVRGVLLLDQ